MDRVKRGGYLHALLAFAVVASACSSGGGEPASSESSSAPSSAATQPTASSEPTTPPEVVVDARVDLDPEFDRPSPDDTVVHLLVTEQACASGQPPGDRLRGPFVNESDDTVRISFGVVAVGGDCPGNPSTSVIVELGEPLGERLLLDGATGFWITWPQYLLDDPLSDAVVALRLHLGGGTAGELAVTTLEDRLKYAIRLQWDLQEPEGNWVEITDWDGTHRAFERPDGRQGVWHSCDDYYIQVRPRRDNTSLPGSDQLLSRLADELCATDG